MLPPLRLPPFLTSRSTVGAFGLKNDVAALGRRVGQPTPSAVKCESRRRSRALQIFRTGDVDDPFVPEAFLVAYFMLLEDDGKNMAHLISAQLVPFVKRFLRTRLYEGSDQNHGWPLQTETNSLAVTLFWLTSSQTSTRDEPLEERHEIMNLLAPYTFASFRYPLAESGTQFRSTHGPYPPPALSQREVSYFGRTFTFQCPSASTYATLSYFCREELNTMTMRLPAFPPKRPGVVCNWPTSEDWEFFFHHCLTRFANPCHPHCADGRRSHRYDGDWSRAMQPTASMAPLPTCPTDFYPMGTLNGVWQGSFIAPRLEIFRSWSSTLAAPRSFPRYARHPLCLTLKEYYCSTVSAPVPEDMFSHLWWMTGCRVITREDGSVDVTNEEGTFNAHYEPLQSNPTTSPPNSTGGPRHVLLLGKTPERHGQAWGAAQWVGDLRTPDGKIVLIRENSDPNLPDPGRGIFEGHLASMRNFCGRWGTPPDPNAPPDTPPYSLPFSLCKAEAVPGPCSGPTVAVRPKTKLGRVMARLQRAWHSRGTRDIDTDGHVENEHQL